LNSFIPYSRQWVDDDDIASVVEALRSDLITQGPKVGELERALASYCGSGYAVSFSSGTAALHAAYFAAGLGPGDEIITSPITFAATANAALFVGARPVFVDIEPGTGNMDASLVESVITDKTKAIVPVHYAGQPVDMDAISDIARSYSLTVIEDACHAFGADYKGRKIGSISHMTVFSFHPLKSFTTGEGGAVATGDENLRKRLEAFRSHGVTKEPELFKGESHGPWYYEMQSLGFNYRLTDIQAALGISQLRKLDGFISRRKMVAAEYHSLFAGNGWFEMLDEKPYAGSAWHLFPVLLRDGLKEKKPQIADALAGMGIGNNVHYIPVYLHPYYRELGFEKGLCPKAEGFYERELSLPIHQLMTGRDVERVAKSVSRCIGGL